MQTSRQDVERGLYQALRLLAVDDQLRELHGRDDDEARCRRDELLDQRNALTRLDPDWTP